jgi:hypothetical protein
MPLISSTENIVGDLNCLSGNLPKQARRRILKPNKINGEIRVLLDGPMGSRSLDVVGLQKAAMVRTIPGSTDYGRFHSIETSAKPHFCVCLK